MALVKQFSGILLGVLLNVSQEFFFKNYFRNSSQEVIWSFFQEFISTSVFFPGVPSCVLLKFRKQILQNNFENSFKDFFLIVLQKHAIVDRLMSKFRDLKTA